MQNTNESIGQRIATLREEKRRIETEIDELTSQVKDMAARGEDASCPDFLVTVRAGARNTVQSYRVKELEVLLPPKLYADLWKASETAAVYVKPRK